MTNDTAMWNAGLLVVNLLALVGLVALVRLAPCWLQQLVVGVLILASCFFVASYFWALLDNENHWRLRGVGYALEHIAVLLYVFRLVYQGAPQPWKSSRPSLN